MKTVLFACVHNAGRSQMAAAWFRALADARSARAVSAGTQPGPRVHPEVIEAMREVGIDLAREAPRRLTDELARGATLLVTMGCGEACPVVTGVRRIDWPLDDPKGEPIERVRELRDEVRARVARLLRDEGWAKTPALAAAALRDRPEVDALLRAGGLPSDLGAFFPGGYVVARDGARVVGCAGLEAHDGDGLLRSVAVAADARALGVGRRLVEDRLDAARRAGLRAVYLLTTGAAGYFRALGFADVPRDAVPDAVRASPQLSGDCCAAAACLTRRLGA